MPRKNKTRTMIEVNQIRADNYVYHFQRRQLARNHPEREHIAQLVAALPKPMLNIYGVAAFEGKASWPIQSHYMRPYFELWKRLGQNFELELEYWYWSDEGWADFEKLWQALPEFVNIPLCTTGKNVHICTQEEYLNPADPA
jgi:hypothetical protein